MKTAAQHNAPLVGESTFTPRAQARQQRAEIPVVRSLIFTEIAHDKGRIVGFHPDLRDDEKLKQLFIGLGQLSGYTGLHFPGAKKVTLERIAAHCTGWIESKGVKADVFAMIHHERRRQQQMFLDGVHPFDIAVPGGDDLLKLRVIGEEIGEVAQAVDQLEMILAQNIGRPTNGRAERIRNRTLELCAELTQVAACAVAWLEALEGAKR